MKDFWYLFAAYSAIWTLLFAYIAHLSKKNKELEEELHALQAQVKRALTK